MKRSDPSQQSSPAERVRALVKAREPIVMGGFYDGVSARLVERAGFPLAFMGGYAVAASLLGEPDIGLLTQAEMADAARRLCRLVSMPVLVDADTGYGGIPNVVRTAELYAQAGAAGLFLEDQVWPKRCGHMAGKEVVPRADWLAKLRAVLALRPKTDLFVVARTDARGPLGLEEAIVRGRAARDLGVDAVFVEAPQSIAELDAIALGIPGAKVANMVEFGRTPLLSPKDLHDRGFDLIVFPVAAILAQAHAVEDVLGTLARDGSTARVLDRLYRFDEFNALMGLDAQREREAAALRDSGRGGSQSRAGGAASGAGKATPRTPAAPGRTGAQLPLPRSAARSRAAVGRGAPPRTSAAPIPRPIPAPRRGGTKEPQLPLGKKPKRDGRPG